MEGLGPRLAAGDPAAFAELYATCADGLHHYLAVRLGSRPDADDVLQETFVRLARARHKLRRVRNLTAYVFTVARNEASRFAERKRREPSAGEALTAEALFDLGRLDDQSRRETAEIVARALGDLAPYEREVVELKTYAGLTFREIAQVTESPQGTVATRYRAALEHLRRELARHFP